MPSKYSKWLEMHNFVVDSTPGIRHGTLICVYQEGTGIWQIQAPVSADIFVQRGRFSISEKGRSHKGQGLVKEGVGA